jgi:hypothetical protein
VRTFGQNVAHIIDGYHYCRLRTGAVVEGRGDRAPRPSS